MSDETNKTTLQDKTSSENFSKKDLSNDINAKKPNNPSLTAAQLKAKFETGDFPLEQDFSDLIDMADFVRAAFVDDAASNIELGNGFTITEAEQIVLDTKEPVYLDATGISLHSSAPFSVEDGALAVNATSGMAVKGELLGVLAGDGIENDQEGVGIKLAKDSGLAFDGHGLKLTKTIQNVPSGTIAILDPWRTIPDGWVVCNGTNNTPNLNGSEEVIAASSGGDEVIRYPLGTRQSAINTEKYVFAAFKFIMKT